MAIKCPKCRAENPETARFCLGCGTRLSFPETPQISATKTLKMPREALSRGTLFAGRYEVIEALGIGGMGEVYQAEGLGLNRQAAIKVLPDIFAGDPERPARFQRKAREESTLWLNDDPSE